MANRPGSSTKKEIDSSATHVILMACVGARLTQWTVVSFCAVYVPSLPSLHLLISESNKSILSSICFAEYEQRRHTPLNHSPLSRSPFTLLIYEHTLPTIIRADRTRMREACM